MSSSSTVSRSDRLTKQIESGIDRVKRASDDESAGSLAGTVKELFDVLVASDGLLQTIDLDRLPDAIEADKLPDLVDLDSLSEAIRTHNPDLAFDLSHLETVVNTQELWDSIDLLEFVKAKGRLDRELEDVLGDNHSAGAGGDSKAASDLREFVSSLRPEAGEAMIHQEAKAKLEVARRAIIESHAAIERQHEANRKRFRNATRKPTGRNRTAVSLLSSGPLPDGASTRLSTVPLDVLHSKNEALPRIYSRRWRDAKKRQQTGNSDT